jgi:hemolysin III
MAWQTCDRPDVQTPTEERANCATHALGLVLSVAALAVLVVCAAVTGDARRVVSVTVFGAALLLVYATSTCYHACTHERHKHRLKVLDHVGIYCLIAGTYTPFLLVLIRGAWGWSLFGVLWGLAAAGTVFKLYFVHRWDVVSTLVYIAMGWIGAVAAGPALQRIPGGALAWIVAGAPPVQPRRLARVRDGRQRVPLRRRPALRGVNGERKREARSEKKTNKQTPLFPPLRRFVPPSLPLLASTFSILASALNAVHTAYTA